MQKVAGQAQQAHRQVEARFEQLETQVATIHGRVESQETHLQQIIQGLFQAQTQRIEELAPERQRNGDIPDCRASSGATRTGRCA